MWRRETFMEYCEGSFKRLELSISRFYLRSEIVVPVSEAASEISTSTVVKAVAHNVGKTGNPEDDARI